MSSSASDFRCHARPSTGLTIRPARPGDEPGGYHVCLKTGNHGQDGEPFYREDPDALGRIFVGPYLAFEPELSLILEDDEGICGYALGALDSRAFYAATKASGGRPVRALSRAAGRSAGLDARRSRCITSIIIPTISARSRTTLSVAPAHRSAAARAGPRLRPPHDRAGMDALAERGSPGAHLA